MNRARILLCGAAAIATILVAASPAAADTTADTVVTIHVTGTGGINITAPATVDIGSGAPDAAITGQLGVVTVTDGRAQADASWLATVTSTDFTSAGLTPIPVADVNYWSGPETAHTGNGTFTPGQPTAATPPALNTTGTPVTAFTHTGGTGNNTASWNPTLIVNVPLTAAVGVYTATVTHSVA